LSVKSLERKGLALLRNAIQEFNGRVATFVSSALAVLAFFLPWFSFGPDRFLPVTLALFSVELDGAGADWTGTSG
jgi:hypothetical protein